MYISPIEKSAAVEEWNAAKKWHMYKDTKESLQCIRCKKQNTTYNEFLFFDFSVVIIQCIPLL